MFEFQKLCNFYEGLSMAEKMGLLTEKSASIIKSLQSLNCPEIDPVSVLAGFILSAVVADGRVDEKEYLMLYPALIRIFGADFDFSSVKNALNCNIKGKKEITAYTENLINILGLFEEKTKWDIISLCLCVTAIDDRISYREKTFIRHLCEAL